MIRLIYFLSCEIWITVLDISSKFHFKVNSKLAVFDYRNNSLFSLILIRLFFWPSPIRYILLIRTQQLKHQWLTIRYSTAAKVWTTHMVSLIFICDLYETKNKKKTVIENLKNHIVQPKCWKWHRLKLSTSQNLKSASLSAQLMCKMLSNIQLPLRFVQFSSDFHTVNWQLAFN